jgi:hypothetical protein
MPNSSGSINYLLKKFNCEVEIKENVLSVSPISVRL